MTESATPTPTSSSSRDRAKGPERSVVPSKPPTKAPKRRDFRPYGALALSAVLAGLLVWQFVRVSQVRRDWRADRAAMKTAHENALTAQAEQLLRTSGSLLGMAISTPLAAEDFEAVENRIKPLLEEKQILVVAVADQTDTIRVSTNHRLEGQGLGEAFPGLALGAKGVVVTKLESGLGAVVAVVEAGTPVGRAVIFYTQEP